MRFVVFGTGGAGGYFGVQLARARQDVVFVARGEHLKAIRRNGLRLETPTGETVIQPAEATDDPAQVVDVGVVLVGVKAWQVTEAAQAIRPMVGPGTFVVPLHIRDRGAPRRSLSMSGSPNKLKRFRASRRQRNWSRIRGGSPQAISSAMLLLRSPARG